MLVQLMDKSGLFKLWENEIIVYMKICSTHLTLKKRLTYVTFTEFWKLNATCNISPKTAELRIWMTLREMRPTRIYGEQAFKCERERSDHIPYATLQTLKHYSVFERRESKWCAVLMKHRRKVKGEQVITLQMA